jgi:hypothetical protein
MGADPPRNRVVADLMWSQEPYRVLRKARVPVHLAVAGGQQAYAESRDSPATP